MQDGGYDISGAKSGSSPNQETDVVIDEVRFTLTSVFVEAYEEEPTSAEWRVIARAMCATAP